MTAHDEPKGTGEVAERFCHGCRHFEEHPSDKRAGTYGDGVCRRYAPRATVAHGDRVLGSQHLISWPSVAYTDWCGDWETHLKGRLPTTLPMRPGKSKIK